MGVFSSNHCCRDGKSIFTRFLRGPVVRMKTRFVVTEPTVRVARWAPPFVPSMGDDDLVRLASEVMLSVGM
jgi:hypothetical protein